MFYYKWIISISLGLRSAFNDVNNWASGLITTIVVGAFVVFVTFLGCCGAYKGKKRYLNIYSVIVGCLFICLLSGFIIALVLDGSDIEIPLKESMKEYYDNEEIKRAWDSLQETVNIIMVILGYSCFWFFPQHLLYLCILAWLLWNKNW